MNNPLQTYKLKSQLQGPGDPELTREYFANRYFSLTLWWRGALISLVQLGSGSGSVSPGRSVTWYSSRVAEAVQDYELGNKVLWADPPLDWSVIASAFQKKVLKTLLKNIGFGRTTSYGELAEMSGSPGAARAVGNAMSVNPWPVIVPCHRVLGKGGPGGFSSGIELKMTLLSLEGVLIRRTGETVAKVPASD